MTVIKVTGLMPGEVSVRIRSRVIGKVFAQAERHTFVPDQMAKLVGWLGGEAHPENYDGYLVPISEFFYVMGRFERLTADWIRTYTLLGKPEVKYIMIGKKYCEEVAYV